MRLWNLIQLRPGEILGTTWSAQRGNTAHVASLRHVSSLLGASHIDIKAQQWKTNLGKGVKKPQQN